MSNFIYSAMSGKNDPMFGKFEHPIKALIENESNICEKRKTILDTLFNVEKSNRYAETIMGESDFSTFMSKQEGQGAENDNVESTFKKTIEHIEFAKEFTITRKMADDAKFGIGADMKNKPRKFVRAYYNTRVKIAAHIGHGAAAAEPAGVLKVQVQAAEVKIDRTHNGFRAVGYALLRVDEPGRILINAHAALGKAGVIAARDREDQLFVRDARRDDPHINAAGRGQPQCALHLVT